MADRYEPGGFEAKWRQKWSDADLFKTREDEGREKFYGLDFFPYPSGAGLSVGHCRNYVPTDVICRMKFMQGFNVLHTMGFDAFGLPAENEAIKNQTHPGPMIEKYAATYRRQMELVGISYDWSRSFSSCEPSYYKWTEWIFQLLYKRGLAYRKLAAVNWDPVDKTVLADEEIIGGRAERSGAIVEKKLIPQWYFKITDYAQRLIDDLDTIDWPEGIKSQQRNWIGRSEGVEFSLQVSFEGGGVGPLALGNQDADAVSSPSSATAAKTELEKLEEEIRQAGFKPEPNPEAELKAARIKDSLAKHSEGAISEHRLTSNAADGFDRAAAKIAGASGDLEIVSRDKPLFFKVFTTRIDTVFGMTFCVLSPEHPILDQLVMKVDVARRQAVEEYRTQARGMSDTDRMATNREKTGVFTGAYAINPVNQQPVPIWVADYVLATYGTGAIMAVPGHDQRDFDFAVKFGLDVVPVIKPAPDYFKQFPNLENRSYDDLLDLYNADPKQFNPVWESKDATLLNSREYDGVTVQEAQQTLGEWFEKWGIGERKVQYKLRDWLISRQRYWGCPIPVIHAHDGELQLVSEDCLPVTLPDVENYEPSGDGSSPLARIEDWVNVTDLDGKLGKRETDTMGGFACSSWYFLRFCDPHNHERAWNPDLVNYWMPVDCYVGGAEHAVMHLLYARFWTKVLYDAGLLSVKEPFARLENQGQVLAHTPYRKPRAGEKMDLGEEGILISFEEAKELPEDQVIWRWSRMSKSKGNVVTPDEAVAEHGADALRVYELFVAPFNADVQWSSDGMQGAVRFLGRVFKLAEELQKWYETDWKGLIALEEIDDPARRLRRFTHQTIRQATDNIERFAFNTYISALMIFVNNVNDWLKEVGPSPTRAQGLAAGEALESLSVILSPAAPHTADELWESLGKEGFTYHADWPKYDGVLAAEDSVTIAVQVNGKLRDTFEMPTATTKEEMEAAALASAKVQAHLEGKTVRKVVVVPGKLVNVVAN